VEQTSAIFMLRVTLVLAASTSSVPAFLKSSNDIIVPDRAVEAQRNCDTDSGRNRRIASTTRKSLPCAIQAQRICHLRRDAGVCRGRTVHAGLARKRKHLRNVYEVLDTVLWYRVKLRRAYAAGDLARH
jgi:hypothetical protein